MNFPNSAGMPGGRASARPLARLMAGVLVIGTLMLATRPVRADVLIDNVDGLTPDGKGGVQRFEAFLIDDQGRIGEVYGKDDKRPKARFQIDGHGRVVAPGMIDAHAHVIETGFARMMLDLSPARSLDEAVSRVAAWAAAHPDAPWILGWGWDERAWGAGALPTATDLDAVTGGRPAWLLRAGGEAGWTNSAGLAAGGITAKSADPTGGRILRAGTARRPSGILLGTARDAVAAKAMRPRPEDRDTAFAAAQIAFLAAGVTTVADMGTSIDDWQALRRAGDLGRLRLRVVAYAGSVTDMGLVGGPGPSPWLYDDKLKMNGLAIELDGTLAMRGAALLAPYDEPGGAVGGPVGGPVGPVGGPGGGASGLMRLNQTQLGNQMSRAAIDNFQVAVTARGDAAVRTVLDALDDLAATYKGDRRWRLEATRLIADEDLARLSGHGVTITTIAGPNSPDVSLDAAAVGPRRQAFLDPWPAIAASGTPLAFGSDSPAQAPRPFAAMAEAVEPRAEDGQPRLTPEQALAGQTTIAAGALFGESRLGRIAKGYRADFLFLDRDPLRSSPQLLGETRVTETWVGGQMAWSAASDGVPRDGR